MQFFDLPIKAHKSWTFLACLFVSSIYALFLFGMTNLTSQATAINQISTWYDEKGEATFKDVDLLQENKWSRVETPLNLGLKQGVYWFKFLFPKDLPNKPADLLEINNPLLDRVDIRLLRSSSFHSTDVNSHKNLSVLDTVSVGDTLPFDVRSVTHNSFVLDLTQYSAPPDIGIVRVQVSGSLKLPIRLWQVGDFIEYTSKQRLIIGIFLGFLIAVAISNLFFYLSTKNTVFLLYTLHVICFSLIIVTLFGYGYQYLWPKLIGFQSIGVVFFANASMLFAMFFTNHFLDVKTHNQRLSAIINGLGWVFLLDILLSFIIPYYYSIRIFFAVLLISLVVVLLTCIWLSLNKITVAKYYTFAWSVFFGCAFAVMCENIGLFMLPGGINGTLLYGVTGESFFLAFVLAISYGNQRDALAKTQAIILQAEQNAADSKGQLLEIQQSAQDELEYKVQERTLELEITLRELSDANAELERLNTIDQLTGIRNRRHFEKRIAAEGRRSRREKTTLCLVMLDIDFFKRVNDEHGHHIGDECLKHIASLAKSFIKRPSDDLCRYGGEEFALILPNTSEDGAVKFVDAIRNEISLKPCKIDGVELNITISAGVASGVVKHDQGEREILINADKALYQAKESGRNRVCSASQLET